MPTLVRCSSKILGLFFILTVPLAAPKGATATGSENSSADGTNHGTGYVRACPPLVHSGMISLAGDTKNGSRLGQQFLQRLSESCENCSIMVGDAHSPKTGSALAEVHIDKHGQTSQAKILDAECEYPQLLSTLERKMSSVVYDIAQPMDTTVTILHRFFFCYDNNCLIINSSRWK